MQRISVVKLTVLVSYNFFGMFKCENVWNVLKDVSTCWRLSECYTIFGSKCQVTNTDLQERNKADQISLTVKSCALVWHLNIFYTFKKSLKIVEQKNASNKNNLAQLTTCINHSATSIHPFYGECSITQFRVAHCLCAKTSLRAKTLLWKCVSVSMCKYL